MDQNHVGVSRKFADHIAKTRYQDLPADALVAYKRAFLDFMTCAITGSAMPVAKSLLAYFEENDSKKTSTVIGAQVKLSPPNAAFINGANVHGLDFDDGFLQAAAHPGGVVFPAVLAAAEQYGSSAREIITAVVVGYDVMLRIGSAMHPVAAKRGFHNTPLSGVFGAAAGVANLLKLTPEQALNALGLAGSFSGGIREYLAEGAEVKRIHPGKAARDGILCAEFARRGITGPTMVLEGRYGVFHTHVDDKVRWDRLLDGIGQRYEICEVYFKPYPSCRGTHAFIDAIKVLRDQNTYSVDEIASLDLGGHGLAVTGHDQKHHHNLLDAQMSIPCAAALAAVFGDVTTRMFEPEILEKAEVERVIQKTNVYIDEECEKLYPPTRSVYVGIGLTDGRKLELRLKDPKGERENPMSNEDLERKLISNCETLIGRERCESLIKQAWGFEALANPMEVIR